MIFVYNRELDKCLYYYEASFFSETLGYEDFGGIVDVAPWEKLFEYRCNSLEGCDQKKKFYQEREKYIFR